MKSLRDYINTVDEAAGVAPVAQAAGKGLARHIPGLGLAVGAYDAYGRAKQGDWAGAGLSAAAGVAGLVPGIGTAASLGIAGAQAMRDKQRTGSYLPGDDEIAAGVAKDATAQTVTTAAAPTTAPAAAPAKSGPVVFDPKVQALQKQLIAKGAKIKPDGKMGPATQAAMTQFPGTAVAESTKQQGTIMSEIERIAELRARLAQIESSPQNEGAWDALAKGANSVYNAGRGAYNVGKNFMGGIGNKTVQGTTRSASELATAQAATNAKRVADGKKALTPAQLAQQANAGIGTTNTATGAAKIANKAGTVIAKNPGKTAIAGTAAGVATGAAMNSTPNADPAVAQTAPAATNTGPAATNTRPPATAPGSANNQSANPAQGAGDGPDPKDIAELNRLAAELKSSTDAEDIAILKRYGNFIEPFNKRYGNDPRYKIFSPPAADPTQNVNPMRGDKAPAAADPAAVTSGDVFKAQTQSA